MRGWVLLLSAWACLAGAQGSVDLPDLPVFLLRYPAVANELKLTPAKVAEIAAIERKWTNRYMAMIAPTPQNPNQVRQPTRKEMAEALKKKDASIASLLSAPQKARLKQIGYQYAGGFALTDRKVAKLLGMSEKQRHDIEAEGLRAIQRMNAATNNTVPRGSGFRNRPSSMKEAIARQTAARTKMMAELGKAARRTLTPKQWNQWMSLQGKAFPVSLLYSPRIPRAAAS